MPMRKNHGSISSNDSGHSEAMSYCEGNVYHLTSSILHNAPTTAAPLPPRRHSAVQQGTGNPYQQMIPPKQPNGDIAAMPPPPNPRTRPVPFPLAVPVLPGANVAGAGVAGYGMYSSQQQQQLSQLRHAGEFWKLQVESLGILWQFLTIPEDSMKILEDP
jgi:hypothetical protein